MITNGATSTCRRHNRPISARSRARVELVSGGRRYSLIALSPRLAPRCIGAIPKDPRIAIETSGRSQKRRSPSRDVCYRDFAKKSRPTPGG